MCEDFVEMTKVMMATGVTSGIGHEIAARLSEHGHHVVLVGRSEERLERVRAELAAAGGDVSTGLCDLSSQASIRDYAASFMQTHERLDVLVNCAGVYGQKRQESVDGIELLFATNVLGYHLLATELLPLLQKSAPARVVVVASEFAGKLDLDDIPFEKRRFNGKVAYQRSKQANRMWTRAFARRARAGGVTVNAMAPGFVATSLYDNAPRWQRPILRGVGLFFGTSVEEGAETAIWLAESDEVTGETGGLWVRREKRPCEFDDEREEERLWEICERLTRAA
jgi:NAD(P)-dependent dehydrogenase (short-subunit alcohol dehydrogenase family)